MSAGFVKVYGTILQSSVWLESAPTRIVWITMLALADAEGIVRAAVPGLAHTANVTLEECQEALMVLAAPDEHSRTELNEGRRIEALQGGWLILNYKQYRELRTEDQIAAAVRQRRKRERDASRDCALLPAEEEEEADKEVELPSIHPPAIAAFLEALPENQNERHWLGIIAGWKQGVGLPGMKAATDEDIATGLTDYLAQNDREFSVIHVRSFIGRQVRSRLKDAARPAPKQIDQAPALWALIKSHRLHLFTSDSDRDVELGAMVEDREITDAEEFKSTMKKFSLKVLREAGTDAIAISHISQRLNGHSHCGSVTQAEGVVGKCRKPRNGAA